MLENNSGKQQSAESPMWAIEIKHVTAGYDRQSPAIFDVNLNVADREFFALIGPNGGGKTTLVRALLGLLPLRQGEILIYGKKPEHAAPLIGYVPQFATCKKSFPITVERMLELGLQNSAREKTLPLNKQQRRDVILETLELIGAPSLGKRRLSELSGGQLQRVLIAQALIREPRLLILDEPTASIDPGGESALFELFEKLLARMTIVIVSHDVHYVTESVSRVGCVNRLVNVHSASALNEMNPAEIYGAPVKAVTHHHH